MKQRSHGLDRGAAVAFRLSRFSSAYRQRLLDGIEDVHKFCLKERECSLAIVASRPKTADRLLCDYVMRRFENGSKGTLSLVKHALLGCQHVFPRLKGKLMTSWSTLKTWEEQRITRLRPPLPIAIWLLALGLARAHAVTAKKSEEQKAWEMFAVLMELGLFCMLRPGEILRLTHDDISLPGSFIMTKAHAAIRITAPKNRRQFGENQFVLVKHTNTIAWLARVHEPNSNKALWRWSSRVFSQKFATLMDELGVKACNFTPASLRPGGATMYFSQGVQISTLRFMGRWTAEKSLEHYIQLAMATQIMNKLDETAVSRLQKLAPLCLAQVLTTDVVIRELRPLPSRKASTADVASWCDLFVSLVEDARTT